MKNIVLLLSIVGLLSCGEGGVKKQCYDCLIRTVYSNNAGQPSTVTEVRESPCGNDDYKATMAKSGPAGSTTTGGVTVTAVNFVTCTAK